MISKNLNKLNKNSGTQAPINLIKENVKFGNLF